MQANLLTLIAQLGQFLINLWKKLYKLVILLIILNRRRLRLQYPGIVFLPCFAHQCNLAVGEIFKESNEFKVASKKALKIVSYFNHAINSYFIGRLQDIQFQIYKTCITLVCPADTRWNSYSYCFKSLIKSHQALQVST